jgi:S-adenosylmethionine:tRNA ribosyltransferase-isomerase
LQVSDFYYDLPKELIAQAPPAERGASRMLVVSRAKNAFHDDVFSNFSRYVSPGDCLVLNNTRVFPARLHGTRNTNTGAKVEVFLLQSENEEQSLWQCLVRPGKRVLVGDSILLRLGLRAEILSYGKFGERTVRFHSSAAQPVAEILNQIGEMPLPPYIERRPNIVDSERYQTIFAKHSGSVAAPTAGLHFTPEILEQCRAAGAKVAEVTLHVGLGTFAPLRAVKLERIQLHEERFEIGAAAAQNMREASRIFCVGTTSVRTVETAASQGDLTAMSGSTNIFIYPGFHFLATGALLTNFHLPESSLLLLVSAFAGRELTLAAYRHAVAARYRFFSYGDCMLIE